MLKRFILNLFFFLILFSSLDASEDPHGRHFVAEKDEAGRTTSLIAYDSKESPLYSSRFFYDQTLFSLLEEHDVLLEGESLRVFSIRRAFNEEGQLTAIAHEGEGLSLMRQIDYSPRGDLKRVLKPDGVIVDYDYDEEGGELIGLSASDNSFRYSYSYDKEKKILTAKDLIHGKTQIRFYNEAHQLVEEIQSDHGTLSYRYDKGERLSKLILPDQSEIHYLYNQDGLMAVKRFSGGQFKSAINVEESGLPSFPLSSATYQADGQIESEEGHRYKHDSLFNRVSENGHQWKVNGINQLIQTENEKYLYDYNGNLAEREGEEEQFRYFYDGLDRLIRVESSQGIAIDYLYDPFFRRIQERLYRQERGEWVQTAHYTYLYDGVDEIGKIDEKGEIVELRVLNPEKESDVGAALLIELKGLSYRPLLDSQGSIRALVALADDKIVERYDYTAFGKTSIFDSEGEEIDQSALGNPWGYFGKRKDLESGFVFFGRRYYAPSMARWTTPDPLHLSDSPNDYAFVLNDPLKRCDAYGLFSFGTLYEGIFSFWDYLKATSSAFMKSQSEAKKIPESLKPTIEKMKHFLFGNYYFLMGFYNDEPKISEFGEHYHDPEKIRVTFVNGILTDEKKMLENLELLSNAHGGEKIHYLFCPTKGWISDITRAIDIKIGYHLINYHSEYSEKLVTLWRQQIEAMGGINGGGRIIHYAHSLGGTETDRARDLLTPEEQKMIDVITFGSATAIRPEGFRSVQNLMSTNDAICLFDFLGIGRNCLSYRRNLHFYGFFALSGIPLFDHLLNGKTYQKLIVDLGEKFVNETKKGY